MSFKYLIKVEVEADTRNVEYAALQAYEVCDFLVNHRHIKTAGPLNDECLSTRFKKMADACNELSHYINGLSRPVEVLD